jgi:hypothetical protein
MEARRQSRLARGVETVMLLTATCWKIGTIDTKHLQRREEHAQIRNARRPGPRVCSRDRGHRRRHYARRDGVQGQILPIKANQKRALSVAALAIALAAGTVAAAGQRWLLVRKGRLAPLIGPRRARNPFDHPVRYFVSVRAVALCSVAVNTALPHGITCTWMFGVWRMHASAPPPPLRSWAGGALIQNKFSAM